MKCPVEDWVMDLGASFHSTPCSRNMKNLRLGNFGSVRLADGAILDVTGIGDVDLKTSLGTTWTLKSVRLIPDLTRMLLSVGQLDDQGYHVLFGNGQWKVVKGNLVIAKGKKIGTLYIVDASSVGVNAMTSEMNPTMLWNQRLGHMSEKGMEMLVARGKLTS